MIQKSIVLIALLLFVQFTFSQEELTETTSKTMLGFNLGGSLSKMRGDSENENYFAAAGFLVGLNFEVSLGKNTFLKTNVNYEKRSYGHSLIIIDPIYGNDPYETDIKIDREYITIPVMFKYTIGKKRIFFVNGGPFVSFLTQRTPFKSPNFGLAAGAGVHFKMDRGTLMFELRNNLGLTDYYGDLSSNIYFSKYELRSNSLSLIATWNFDL